jgi:transmembrane 9 superfamily protein 2/4
LHLFHLDAFRVIVLWAVQGLVAMILVRALYRDFSRYNRVATDEEKAEDKEETGWKLVHADVFRPPTRLPLIFAVTVGTGTQVG